MRALNGLFWRLAEARERERNFTAYAAHELKTPLAGLRTQAQVALASGDGASREQALRRIVQGVDRTSRLVRQLLDLAEVEAGRTAMKDAPVPISDLVHEILDGLSALSLKHAVEIEVSCAVDTLILRKGRPLLTLALRNILENALLYSLQESAVRFTADLCESAIAVRIEDQGPGMDSEGLARARDRFYRSGGATGSGSGLGLSIADAAVEALGGQMILQSGENSGLTVILCLPPELFTDPARPEHGPTPEARAFGCSDSGDAAQALGAPSRRRQ